MRAPSKTKFFEAVRGWQAAEVAVMLRVRPDLIFIVDNFGRTALHVCANREMSSNTVAASIATAKALVKAGADVNAIQPIKDGREVSPATPLWYALAWGRNQQLAGYFLKCQADPNHCMFALVYADNLTSARLLRRHGARLEDSFDGETPLIYAARHSRTKFVDWLLREGVNPNTGDRRGLTALHHAVRRRLPDSTLRSLVKCGADVRARSKEGVTVAALATRAQKRLLGIADD
jgi:ankyrin repeat protein